MIAVQELANWSNYHQVPLCIDRYIGELHLYYFEKDVKKIELLSKELPAGILVKHFLVPNDLPYNNKSLIEYKKEI